MTRSIKNLKGIKELSNSKLKQISGGTLPTEDLQTYTCWDNEGDYQSQIDVSGSGTTCVYNSVKQTVVVGPRG